VDFWNEQPWPEIALTAFEYATEIDDAAQMLRTFAEHLQRLLDPDRQRFLRQWRSVTPTNTFMPQINIEIEEQLQRQFSGKQANIQTVLDSQKIAEAITARWKPRT
jgi:hypothetical protein